jgi:hypothetical protein
MKRRGGLQRQYAQALFSLIYVSIRAWACLACPGSRYFQRLGKVLGKFLITSIFLGEAIMDQQWEETISEDVCELGGEALEARRKIKRVFFYVVIPIILFNLIVGIFMSCGEPSKAKS